MLELKNVCLDIKDSQCNKTKSILKNISAVFEPGKINCIMGPNGSGKTMLLSLIYGRCNEDTLTSGHILHNESLRNEKEWYKLVGFVEQDRFAIPNKTVRQLFQEYKELLDYKSDEEYTELIQNLELTRHLDTQVESLSGGERERVFILTCMLQRKQVLLLDEPISDLDSHLAYNFVYFLKRLTVQRNLIVIMTVHQPSPKIFNIFDNFFFLYNGYAIYSGPINNLEKSFEEKDLKLVEDFTFSEFLFELFSFKSYFKEIEFLRPQVNRFMASLNSNYESVKHLLSGHPTRWIGTGPTNIKTALALVKSMFKQHFKHLSIYLLYSVLIVLNTDLYSVELMKPFILWASPFIMETLSVLTPIGMPYFGSKYIANFTSDPEIILLRKQIFSSIYSFNTLTAAFLGLNCVYRALTNSVFILFRYLFGMIYSDFLDHLTFFTVRSVLTDIYHFFMANLSIKLVNDCSIPAFLIQTLVLIITTGTSTPVIMFSDSIFSKGKFSELFRIFVLLINPIAYFDYLFFLYADDPTKQIDQSDVPSDQQVNQLALSFKSVIVASLNNNLLFNKIPSIVLYIILYYLLLFFISKRIFITNFSTRIRLQIGK